MNIGSMKREFMMRTPSRATILLIADPDVVEQFAGLAALPADRIQMVHLQRDPSPRLVSSTCCGSIIAMSRESLTNERLRHWTQWCLSLADQRTEFRVFPMIRGIDWMQPDDPLCQELRDRYQGFAGPSNVPSEHNVVDAILTHLVHAEENREAVRYERFATDATIHIGELAENIQRAFVCVIGLALLGVSSTTIGWSGWPALVALSATTVMFPGLSVLANLFWKVRTYPGITQDTVDPTTSLRRFQMMSWWLRACFVMGAGSWIMMRHDVPHAWAYAGMAVGTILDVIRRCKFVALRRQISALARHTRERPDVVSAWPATRSWKDVENAALAVNPLKLPIYGFRAPRVFISYAEQPGWSATTAHALHRELEGLGVESFCAGVTISTGAPWRERLDHALGRADVVISVTDPATSRRMWPDAELRAAMEARLVTGVPAIAVLCSPEWAAAEVEGERPAFLVLREGLTQEPDWVSIADASVLVVQDPAAQLPRVARWVSARRQATVLPHEVSRLAAQLLMPVSIVVTMITTLLAQTGGAVWLALTLARVPVLPWLVGLLSPPGAILVVGFLAGATLRLTLGWRFEVARLRSFRAFAKAGLLTLVALGALAIQLCPAATPLALVWAGSAAAVGWWRSQACLGLMHHGDASLFPIRR